MITEFSLETLVAISEHPAISKRVKHLIIGLDNFKAVNPDLLPDMVEYERFQSALQSQERLMDTGRAIDLLTKALAKLPELETVDIRDFNSATRYRDTIQSGPGRARVPEWISYGSAEYRGWLGHLGSSLIDGSSSATSDFVDRTFKIVLTAVGRTAPRLETLQVIIRNSRIGLRDGAFALFPAPESRLDTVLEGLTTLHLDLHLESPAMSRDFSDFPSTGRNLPTCYDPATTNVRHFLSCVPNVTWLRLNVVHMRGSASPASMLLAWLGLKPSECTSESWTMTNPKPVDLPLQKLELGNFNLSPDVLVDLVKKFGLLKWLSLRSISLRMDADNDAEDDDDNDGDDADQGSPWPKYFRKLPGRAPNLRSLSLRNLRVIKHAASHWSDVIVFVDGNLEFATPSPFVKELRDLDMDRTKYTDLAAATWSRGEHMKEKARRGLSRADSSDEDEDDDDDDDDAGGGHGWISPDSLRSEDFESEEVDDDDMAEDLDEE